MSIQVKALREHPRRAGRYVVELVGELGGPEAGSDPRRVGPVDAATIGDLEIRVGSEVAPATLESLRAAARGVACYDKALDALARRARSEADLARWLRQREFTAAEIGPAIEKLTALGLLNDLEFARGFARSRMAAGRGFGPRRVAAELARRGVGRAVVDAVLAELGAEGDMEPAAQLDALVERRMKALRGHDQAVAQRRVRAWLARRGFGLAAIQDAMRRYATGT